MQCCGFHSPFSWFQSDQRLPDQYSHWCSAVDFIPHSHDFSLVKTYRPVVELTTSHAGIVWSGTCRSAATLMWWRWLPHRLQWSQAGQRLAGQQPHWCGDVDYLTDCSDLRLVRDLQVNSCTDVMTLITSHIAVISGWSKTCRSTAALMWWRRLPRTLPWFQAGQRLAGQQPHWCDDLYDELMHIYGT